MTFTPTKLIDYKYYLFSDILIYGKSYLGKVIQPKKLYLKDCDVDTCNYSFREKYNLFIIKSKDNSFYVSANSLEEKMSWIEEIRKYIYQQRNENNIDSTNLNFAPILQLEEVVSTCYLCNSVFSWSNKKIHCLNCGNIFCKKCTSYNAIVPYSNDTISVFIYKLFYYYFLHRKLYVKPVMKNYLISYKLKVIKNIIQIKKIKNTNQLEHHHFYHLL